MLAGARIWISPFFYLWVLTLVAYLIIGVYSGFDGGVRSALNNILLSVLVYGFKSISGTKGAGGTIVWVGIDIGLLNMLWLLTGFV